MMKNGLLLINLGTPDSPGIASVRRYLSEFLCDRRVINLPALLRYALVYCTILPFRPQMTAKAYQKIWRSSGSPLLIHSQNLTTKLQQKLGERWQVSLAMRYGKPSIAEGLKTLQDCEKLIILPLYPQYSNAANGSAIAKVIQLMANEAVFPTLTLIRDFCQHPGFIEAQAAQIKPHLASHEHLLLSYHGVPENHLKEAGCRQICPQECPSLCQNNQTCYKAQCYATTKALARKLDLKSSQYSVSFQSRLGRTPWIKPYTDELLRELSKKGVKRLAVACPSFVADCLETLEEIGIRAKKQWQELGGEQFTLIPCVNDNDLWVDGLINIVEESGF